MKIALCDDEKLFADMLRGEIEKYLDGEGLSIDYFRDGDEIVSAIENGILYDVLFLDIEMERTDGMTAAKKIRGYAPEMPVIFLTSHTELAPEGYEVNAFRFLRKPVDGAKLEAALRDLEALGRKKRALLIKDGGSEYRVFPDEIIYAGSDNNDVCFVTEKRVYRARMKFSEAEKLLSGASSDFVKIHRCVIVNLAHVASCRADEAVTDSGERLLVSRKLSEKFHSEMLCFIRKNAR